jgi:tetratricopeptide (TPR) repeat protein
MKYIITVLLLTNLLGPNLMAIEATPAYKEKLKARMPGLTSKAVQKRLLRANNLMAKNNRKDAIEILKGIVEKDNYRPFELAKAWQTMAYAYAQSEQYKEAKHAFTKSIEMEALPYDPTLQSLFALAQLQVVAEDYNKAEKTLNTWFALSDRENPDAYVFMATIHYNKNQKDKALELVMKAINMSKKPKENWLVFAVSLLYSKEKYKEAAEFLYKLVEINHGKKSYWSQLAGSLLSNDQGLLALSALELAMMLDLLKEEGEIKNIVSLYLSNELPYEASQIMKVAMKNKQMKGDKKNYELYANCLIQAKEYDAALPILEKAAELSDDGKLFALQARLYLEKEKFNESIKYFNLAIKKGLKKEMLGKVLVEKAVSYIQLKDYKSAMTILDKAATYESGKKLAANWRSYLNSL